MASHGKADAYTAAPLWALMQVNLAPTLVNMGPVDSAAVVKLFENAEADDFITNATIGLFNYADGEVPAGAGHAGWNLKVTGKSSSGRDGRVQYETLVALTDAA
jgi:hypothetical protein